MPAADEAGSQAGFRYWEMVITIFRGPRKGRVFAFASDVVSVGKSPQNSIFLDDETVSRQHLEILREARGYLLRDLGSTNGTFLDGAEIREAYLRSGSVVRLGKTWFRFRPVQRVLRPAPFRGAEFEGLVGTTPAMRDAFGLAQAVAPLDLTVLILGEPGTGRRSLARALHRAGPLADAPCTVVRCDEEPSRRLEKALFGKRGAIERSEGGTIVLFEPWEIPPDLQVRVAEGVRRRRALSSAAADRSTPGQRFLAVTSRKLGPEVEAGRLHEDLRAMLERVCIALPPLRERTADIPLLVSRLLERSGSPEEGVARRLAGALLRFGEFLPWVGNVAELEQTVLNLTTADEERSAALLREAPLEIPTFEPDRSFGWHKSEWLGRFERQYLAWLLEQHAGNVSAASRAADMDRKHLHRLLKRYGLR